MLAHCFWIWKELAVFAQKQNLWETEQKSIIIFHFSPWICSWAASSYWNHSIDTCSEKIQLLRDQSIVISLRNTAYSSYSHLVFVSQRSADVICRLHLWSDFLLIFQMNCGRVIVMNAVEWMMRVARSAWQRINLYHLKSVLCISAFFLLQS